MESEQQLAAREPLAVDLENEEDLANTNQITNKTNIADALPIEVEQEAEEGTEESSEDTTREVSVPEEDKIVESDDNNNNEETTNPEPDARRKSGVQRKHTQGRRYFDPPESSLEESEEEYKRGKKSKSKKKRKPCYICAEIGHQGDRCFKVFNCSICSKKGNLFQDPLDKNVDVDSTSGICLMCGNAGHDMFSCTNNYDPEDLKEIECYVCRKTGHLCCVEKKTDEPRETACYNCGKIGHSGSDCPCPKPNEVTDNRQQLCSKCAKAAKAAAKKEAAAARAAKKRARSKARRWKNRTIPTVNASYQVQPTVWMAPPIVGPYYGNPGANVWLSPTAAAARTGPNHPIEASPSHPPVYHHQVQVGTQVLTHLSRVDARSQNEAQIPKLHINQETETMLPQTKTDTGNQVQQKLFDPTNQPHQREALPYHQPQKPFDRMSQLHQTEALPYHRPIYNRENQVEQKSFDPMSQLHHGEALPSHQPISHRGNQVQQRSFDPMSQLHPMEALPSRQPMYHTGNQVQQKPFDPMSQPHPFEALPSRQPIYHRQVGGNQVPSQIQREPFYPMSQLPRPMWNSHRDGQTPQPHQSGFVVPQTESRVPQNSSSRFPPHLVYNGDQRSPSYHPTAALVRQEQNIIRTPFPPQTFHR